MRKSPFFLSASTILLRSPFESAPRSAEPDPKFRLSALSPRDSLGIALAGGLAATCGAGAGGGDCAPDADLAGEADDAESAFGWGGVAGVAVMEAGGGGGGAAGTDLAGGVDDADSAFG